MYQSEVAGPDATQSKPKEAETPVSYMGRETRRRGARGAASGAASEPPNPFSKHLDRGPPARRRHSASGSGLKRWRTEYTRGGPGSVTSGSDQAACGLRCGGLRETACTGGRGEARGLGAWSQIGPTPPSEGLLPGAGAGPGPLALVLARLALEARSPQAGARPRPVSVPSGVYQWQYQGAFVKKRNRVRGVPPVLSFLVRGAEGLPSTRNWPCAFQWLLPPTSPPQVVLSVIPKAM